MKNKKWQKIEKIDKKLNWKHQENMKKKMLLPACA
jgi:hypothetical protein